MLSNGVIACCLYREGYLGRTCPDRKTFVSKHRSFCDHRNFAPYVAYRRRPNCTVSEVEQDVSGSKAVK
jgi:hypothetical protein